MRQAFVWGLLGLTACAMSTDVAPPSELGLNRQLLTLSEVSTGVYELSVSKDALADGTEFLLSTSVISTSAGEPSFTGALSQVVFFKRADGQVQMLESTKGSSIAPKLVRPNVITSFPVISEDATTVSPSRSATSGATTTSLRCSPKTSIRGFSGTWTSCSLSRGIRAGGTKTARAGRSPRRRSNRSRPLRRPTCSATATPPRWPTSRR